MRKLTVFLLVCALCFLTVFCAGSAEDANGNLVSGNYQYMIQDDGTAVITGYEGKTPETLTIPDSLDGIQVTAIGSGAFQWQKTLMKVAVPEGVVSLGDHAFLYCDNLSSVTLPDSLKDIGRNPFAACPVLSVANIVLSADHPYLKVEEGVLYSLADNRLVCYSFQRAGRN